MNFIDLIKAFFALFAKKPDVRIRTSEDRSTEPQPVEVHQPVKFPPIMGKMKASDACLKIIKEFEGFRSKPYRCPADVPTIGFGSTRYEGGKAVSMSDPEITVARGLDLLRLTLPEYEGTINRLVTVPLKQCQFDALVSLTYNIGARNFGASTLLRKLNEGNYDAPVFEFGKWTRGGGVILPGLVRRREAEAKLFMGPA